MSVLYRKETVDEFYDIYTISANGNVIGGEGTISSLRIRDLIEEVAEREKRVPAKHKHILRDMRKLSATLGIRHILKEGLYTDSRNKSVKYVIADLTFVFHYLNSIYLINPAYILGKTSLSEVFLGEGLSSNLTSRRSINTRPTFTYFFEFEGKVKISKSTDVPSRIRHHRQYTDFDEYYYVEGDLINVLHVAFRSEALPSKGVFDLPVQEVIEKLESMGFHPTAKKEVNVSEQLQTCSEI